MVVLLPGLQVGEINQELRTPGTCYCGFGFEGGEEGGAMGGGVGNCVGAGEGGTAVGRHLRQGGNGDLEGENPC